MYDALDIKNIEAILPPKPQPKPVDPATENGNAMKRHAITSISRARS